MEKRMPPPPMRNPSQSAASAAGGNTGATVSRPTFNKPPSLPSSKPPTAATRTAKTFTASTWTGAGEGVKTILYGPNGMGKTTLASMTPNPIFLGLDDGGRKTLNPKTGEALTAINGVETFQDLRDATHQADLFPAGSTLVLDTITKAEELIKQHVLLTIKKENGQTASSLEDYGYGKGYVHLTDAARLLLADLDGLVRRGVNVLLLAQQSQATVANLEGIDYAQDGPALTGQPKAGMNVRSEFCSWADNVFRVGYPAIDVVKANKQAVKGKASGSTERVIYTEPEVYFLAKNRSNGTLPAIIAFATRDDDSLWTYLFGGAK